MKKDDLIPLPRPRKVAIVGNESFPVDANIGTQVVEIMRTFEEPVFLIRGVSGIEQFVAHAAIVLGRPVFKYPALGGGDNFERNRDLVGDADVVLAFLDPGTLDVETGAQHVIEAALSARKPTRAYTLVEGRLVWAGETEEALT